jgi:hypothetical protein
MQKVIHCECPTLAPDCASGYKRSDGTPEPSFGLAQIDLDYHPNISYQQATDPDFAISYMAESMGKGIFSPWHCFTKLKKNGEL